MTTGYVKWYSRKKRYGFIVCDEPAAEAFVHENVLTPSGLSALSKGDLVTCNITTGSRGMQVKSITKLNGKDVGEIAKEASGTVTGRVKWYRVQPGYGFVMLDDKREAFVHAGTLSRCGISELASNQLVICEIAHSERGLQVQSLEIRTDANR